jgi:tetratricopeptide (TPR) repeat protein
MSACWHGELDNALQHALRAVELERSIASYRDTLAEVFFQLGNVSEAVRHEQECLRQEPGNEHFQSQLIRFQTVLGNSVQ